MSSLKDLDGMEFEFEGGKIRVIEDSRFDNIQIRIDFTRVKTELEPTVTFGQVNHALGLKADIWIAHEVDRYSFERSRQEPLDFASHLYQRGCREFNTKLNNEVWPYIDFDKVESECRITATTKPYGLDDEPEDLDFRDISAQHGAVSIRGAAVCRHLRNLCRTDGEKVSKYAKDRYDRNRGEEIHQMREADRREADERRRRAEIAAAEEAFLEDLEKSEVEASPLYGSWG